MKKLTVFALMAVLVLGGVIILGSCSSGGGSTPSSPGNTSIENNTQGTEAASGISQGINMSLGINQAFGNLGNIGFAQGGIQAPSLGAFGNFQQTPAIGRLVNVTSKFAVAQAAITAASSTKGGTILQLGTSGSGTCADGGSYTLGASTDGGIAAIFFSGCRENDMQADGEYDILIFGPVTSGYSISGTLGSSVTPTAFTLQDFGPGYSTLISTTTMTGLPFSVTLTYSGSSVTAVEIAVSTGSMSIYDDANGQTYSVSITGLYDDTTLSTSGTGTVTTSTMKGVISESWGSDSITAQFTNFQLVISPESIGSLNQDLSISGTFSIAYTPASLCQDGSGTFTVVTDSPIEYDASLGYTTSGELTVNGATTIMYNADGSVTVTTGGNSQTYDGGYDLTQVCPFGTLGGPAATYTVTYNGNNNNGGGTAPIDLLSPYQPGQSVTVLGNTGGLVNGSLTFVGWNMSATGGAATTYAPGDQFRMPPANVTLYAVWTASPYTVTYNGGAATTGSVPVDPNYYEAGQSVTVLGNTGGLAYPGYTFAGWQLALNGSSTTYQPGQTFPMPASDVVLVAQWTSSTVLGYAYVADYGSGGPGISQFAITSDGTLSALSPPTVAAGSNPLSITADPSGRYVYATDVADNYRVYQYTIGTGGLLTPMTPPYFAADGYPSSVIADPTGPYVYVANYSGSSISQYTISGTGSLMSMSTPTVAVLAGSYALATDPSGSFLYAAVNSATSGTVSLYDIGTGGALSSVVSSVPTDPFTWAIAVSYPYVYAASFGIYVNAIYQFATAADGTLSPLSPSYSAAGEATSALIAVSGKYVYVVNVGSNADAPGYIGEYAIASGGTLSALSTPYAATGDDPMSIAVDPTSQYVYVTNFNDGTISQYMINGTGSLISLDTPTVAAGYGPRSIVTVGSH